MGQKYYNLSKIYVMRFLAQSFAPKIMYYGTQALDLHKPYYAI